MIFPLLCKIAEKCKTERKISQLASSVKENMEKLGTALVSKVTDSCRQIKRETDLNNNHVQKFEELSRKLDSNKESILSSLSKTDKIFTEARRKFHLSNYRNLSNFLLASVHQNQQR